MFELFFKGLWRSSLAERWYSSINVAGLAIGLACVLLVGLYIDHELAYDAGFPDGERTFRLSTEVADADHGETRRFAGLTAMAFEPIRRGVTQAEVVARVFPVLGTARVRVGDSQYNQRGVATVDPEIIDILRPTFLAGDPATALDGPGKVVITRATANRYFGSEDPMGQVMNVYRQGDLTVTGVIEDLPENGHLPLTVMVPMSNPPRPSGC